MCAGIHPFAFALEQDQAHRAAADLQRVGSDQSLQQSSIDAMVAVMNAASFNYGGAIAFGTMAYGGYRHSEELDLTGDVNAMNDIMLLSVDDVSGALRKMKSFKTTKTTYNRLDPGYLREGKAAEVAAEFERRSGLSRDKFLEIMGKVSESKVRADDPNMVDTVLTRFEGLIEHIPNEEFRDNLKKAVDKVPNTVRRGIVGKAVHHLAEFMAEVGIDDRPKVNFASKPKRIPSSLNSDAKEPVSITKLAATTGASKTPIVEKAKEKRVLVSGPSLMLIDDEPQDKLLQGFLGNTEGDVNVSIFERVSKRYAVLQSAGFGQ